MKNLTLTVSLVAVALLAGFSLVQWRQSQALKAEVAALRAEIAARAQKAQAETASALETAPLHGPDHAPAIPGEPPAIEAPMGAPAPVAAEASAPDPAAPKPAEGGLGEMLSKMMKDPAMKQMLRQQQTAMVDMMYGPMFKELGLSSEEADKLKELLLDRQMKAVDQAGALMQPAEGSSERAQAMEALTQQQKDSEEQVKALLGEDRYAQYKDYTGTLGERMQLNQFSQQVASGPNALTENQTQRMLEIMKVERAGVFADANTDPAASVQEGMDMMMSEDRMQKMLGQQEEVNRRVLNQAGTVLNAEQLQSFGSFQSNQMAMQRMAMTMASKMFGTQGSKEGAAPTPAPAPAP